jgi:hypothetical protein
MPTLDQDSVSKGKWESELLSIGFSTMQDGHCYTLDGITLRVEEKWIHLETISLPASVDPLIYQMGKPGLWKCVTTKENRIRRLFEFPLSVATTTEHAVGDEIKNGMSPLKEMVSWARTTVNGNRTKSWHPPSHQEMNALIIDQGLTVQCDSHALQGELVCESNCLALRFPIVLGIPHEICESRNYWLRRLLIDAQNRWKMVRVGFSGDHSGKSAQVEVNLTGAPHAVLPDIVSVALAALRAAVAWMVPSAVFLVDERKNSAAFNSSWSTWDES